MKKLLKWKIVCKNERLRRTILKMKTLCLIFLITVLNASASVYSQGSKLSITFKETSIEDVFVQIQKQTDYSFLYNNEELKKCSKISIDIKDKEIDDVVKECLKNTHLSYKIVDKVIIITPKSSKNQKSTQNPDGLYQTVRGTVIDNESMFTLPGANIVVLGSDPLIGATTNADGEFKLENVPVGRHTLRVTYIGYEEAYIPEILVGSAKEVILKIPLTESVIKMDEVVFVAYKKGEPKNDMATVSARSFTVEETGRYAASLNDPGRMALSFAGVTNSDDISNEIVIRGNDPSGLLWRLEGVEIPSPNHFAEESYSSGYVSILNANVVGKSDFFTGAFPAEYGNALSGIFDLTLRKGNNEKREYAFQLGVMGTDFTLEGPFKKDYKGSYLINYRYSTFGILDMVGFGLEEMPVYQDLSFNFNFPTKKAGTFSLWGIGGLSNAGEQADADSTLWEDQNDRENESANMGMTATGLTHIYFPDEKSYFKTVISFSGNKHTMKENYYEVISNEYIELPKDEERIYSSTYRASTFYNRKFSNVFTLRTGFIFSALNFNYFGEGIDDKNGNVWNTFVDDKGTANTTQAFVMTKYRLNEMITLNTGLHYMYFSLNQKSSIEPRAGISWKFAPKQSLSFGFGLHSRIEKLSTYFAMVLLSDGTFSRPNLDLDLTKAAHYVLSYDYMLGNDYHIKAELYYQDLYQIPVATNTQSTISPINGREINDSLSTTGMGENYGLELTIEKFFTNDFYFLITSSLFDSKYKASDGNWYSTKYDVGFANNFVGGKEFKVGKNKNNLLGLNARFIWSGGKRDTPVDLEKSLAEGYPVYDVKKTYAKQYDDYFRMDFGISYRVNKPKVAHVFSVDIQNIINRKNIKDVEFDEYKLKEVTDYQNGLLPNINYRIEF